MSIERRIRAAGRHQSAGLSARPPPPCHMAPAPLSLCERPEPEGASGLGPGLFACKFGRLAGDPDKELGSHTHALHC